MSAHSGTLAAIDAAAPADQIAGTRYDEKSLTFVNR